MAVYVGSARIDERGKASGGKAGDQNGKELSLQKWYRHSGGWTAVIHIVNPTQRKKYLDFIKWACANKLIGYDQYERTTLYKAIKELGFSNYKKLNKKVECDCSSLVACGLIVAGIDVPYNWRTGTIQSVCKEAKYKGILEVHTSSAYLNGTSKLYNGDIINKSYSHVVTVISGAKDFETSYDKAKVKQLQETLNKDYGSKLDVDGVIGSKTKAVLKKVLLKKGDYTHPNLTKFVQATVGADQDGKYGSKTATAVKEWQAKHSLKADSEAGINTLTKMCEV